MKVLILHNQYNQRGGEDSVFESEVELLRSAGHNVQILVFRNSGFTRGSAKIFGALLALFNVFSFIRTIRTIRSFRPAVMHVHNVFSTATPAVIWAARFYRVPVVMTLHNFRLLCPSALLYHHGSIYENSIKSFFPIDAIRKRVYRDSLLQTLVLAVIITFHRQIGTWNGVRRFIVLSDFALGKFLESRLMIPRNRYVTKPNFVPDRGLSFDKEKRFLFVGRLSSEKGIMTMLKAFKNSSFQLAIVGDGPLRSDVESFIKCNANVEYLGPKPPTEIIGLMKRAYALVFPSLWYEGMPMVLLESFSAGTPVIASNLGSMAEMIEDRINGLHFAAGSIEELEKAIALLAEDTELHQQLCINARKSWESKYSPEINLELLLNVYRSAIND